MMYVMFKQKLKNNWIACLFFKLSHKKWHIPNSDDTFNLSLEMGHRTSAGSPQLPEGIMP